MTTCQTHIFAERPLARYLVPVFIFFFCTFAFCQNDTAISVNGDRIYKDDLDHALAVYEDSYKRYFGENIDAAVNAKMKKELIDDLIDRQLYIQEAKRRGITAKVYAGEEEIEELMMKDPRFRTEGRFDDRKYEQFNMEGVKEVKAFRDRAEAVILAEKIREVLPSKVIAALKEDVSISDKEVLDEYFNRAEKMRVAYVKIDPVSIANNTDISEDEIRSYYEQHQEVFRVPKTLKYAQLYFDPEDSIGKVSVSDGMLREYYEEHREDYWTSKQVQVKYVLFNTKDYTDKVLKTGVNPRQYYENNLDKFIEPAEARVSFLSMKKPVPDDIMAALIKDMAQNMEFSFLAKKYSDDPSTSRSGGDLGYVRKGTLKDPFDGVAFGLETGEASNIIETDKGYYVIAVQDKKAERVRTYEEVKDEIERDAVDYDARPFALADARRFRIEAARSGFEAAAKRKNMVIHQTDHFKSSDRLPLIGKNNLFISAAMQLGTGEVSNAIECDNGYAVLIVDDILPREQLSYSDVAGDIERKIIQENSFIYAGNDAKHALSLLEEGVTLNELKKRMSVHVSFTEVSSTLESPAELNKISRNNDGYYLTVLAGEQQSYIPELFLVSDEAASIAALAKADDFALKKANDIILSGSMEAAVISPPFQRGDYLIGREYMRPFIEQSFSLPTGKIELVKSLGKYYVVKVLERGLQLSGYEDESSKIKSEVLREKRDKHVKNWLKQERDKAEIQVNI